MRKTLKRNSVLSLLSGAVIIAASISTASAQTGFSIESQNLFRIPDAQNGGNIDSLASLDLTLDTDLDPSTNTGPDVIASVWAALVEINIGASAGDFGFIVPEIFDDEPNLSIADNSPFTDFDRDFEGMSYGDTSGTALAALSLYIEPEEAVIPTTDANGNLTVPDGAGLVSIPLRIGATGWDADNGQVSANTQLITFREAVLTFDDKPVFTGVGFKTGPGEDDTDIHTALGNTSAVVTVYQTVQGDSDLSGIVDLADFGDWLNNLGSLDGEWTQGNWDTAGPGIVDLADFGLWLNNLGTIVAPSPAASASVPEPTSLLLLIASAPAIWLGRRRRSR